MKCRFVICIPVFDNPGTIVDVIEACLLETPHPVFVIDDGSQISVESLFKARCGPGEKRVSFYRDDQNQGKGQALQRGFVEAVRCGFTHLIAIDGDGQHVPAEIVKLERAAIESPWALIVGDRDMKSQNVPASSVFGKKFSNFWVRYQTDVGVGDSQSGFRIYPLYLLQNMKFYCKKYDFEIEVLIRLIWSGVAVRNVKISVHYFPPGIRVSHFDKWKDNLRISILNTLLTIGAMLREQTSPFKSSLALGLGVFVGTLPIYGLHTGIVGFLALIFRLNFVYIWVGTNISIPPLVPFLVYGSHVIGSNILLESSLPTNLLPISWIFGSIVLGVLLGVLFGMTLFVVKRSRLKSGKNKGIDELKSKSKNRNTWSGENANRPGILFVEMLLRLFGQRWAYASLYFIVFYYFIASRSTRVSLEQYWKITHPSLGFWKRQLKIYQQILIFAKTLVDRGIQRAQRDSDPPYFSYELDDSAKEVFRAFSSNPRGIVAVTSHIGGWEIATSFLARIPTEKKMLVVMHGIPGQYAHQSLESSTSKTQPIFFNLNENTLLKVKDFLREKHIVGMMGDRPVTKSYELQLFFGKLAAFDTTPFRLALACESDICFVFALKKGNRKYKILANQFSPSDSLNREILLASALNEYIRQLEKVVLSDPTQWFNFFPFWKASPHSQTSAS
ncbi:MAG: DUF2062 domain-containing protein [Bdellovibrionaceae bacterium]|nr:DUF2062 domain-containing protein [Pseudobdellovibrionaceae bacterium]